MLLTSSSYSPLMRKWNFAPSIRVNISKLEFLWLAKLMTLSSLSHMVERILDTSHLQKGRWWTSICWLVMHWLFSLWSFSLPIFELFLKCRKDTILPYPPPSEWQVKFCSFRFGKTDLAYIDLAVGLKYHHIIMELQIIDTA